MMASPSLAPPLRVSQWFNTDQALSLPALRGRVVLIHAFQMLCPGCVSHGIPQAAAVHAAFAADDVAVIGLHSVFEHHEAMAPHALQAFIHEYRINFPVGVDEPDPQGPVPLTMQAYGLRGTPSLILLDRQGMVRLQHFGRLADLGLGAAIGELRAGAAGPPLRHGAAGHRPPHGQATPCDDQGCSTGHR